MEFTKDHIKLFNIDCMEYMATLPDKAFDLAIVDPPYGIGIAEWDRPPSEVYFRELFRISENQIIWGGNYFALPITEAWVCWHKTAGFTRRALNSQSDFELAWTSYGRKARLIPYTYSGNIKGLNGNRVDYRYRPIHPTQKPVELYKLLLEEYAKEGDRILDTHLGSGSSAIAAHDFGIAEFIGCEISKDYFDAAVQRFKIHLMQQKLF